MYLSQKGFCNSLFTSKLKIAYTYCDTEHFYSTRNELGDLFAGKKNYIMETFYRYMRKKHDVLIVDGNQPLNGKWNFDEDNRMKLPKDHKPISAFVFENDLSTIELEIKKAKIGIQINSLNGICKLEKAILFF